uniref:hypothetical protein n=1 Tax=Lacrimispora amygdalina TaxID=253257 RepID=UPI00140ABAA3
YLKENDTDYQYEEFVDYCKENGIEIKDEDYYLLAEFYTYTTEGDTNGDDAWLYDHIPEEFKDRMYQGDSD